MGNAIDLALFGWSPSFSHRQCFPLARVHQA